MTGYLLASAGQVSLLILAGLAAAAIMRRRSAALRHWVLAAVLFAAAGLPALQALAPRWDIGRSIITAGRREASLPQAASATAKRSSVSVTMDATPVAGRADERNTEPSAWHAVVLGWAVGAAAALALLAVGLGRLCWLARRARPIDDPLWVEIAANLSRHAGVRRHVALLHSDHRVILAAWGWRKPVILVPRSAIRWSRPDVEMVLRHEIAHIARGDWLPQVVAEVVLAFNWFNPLVWIATRRLRAESERACDDAVLAQGMAGPDYAERLISLARRLDARSWWRGVFPAPAMARPSSLERRVAAMLNTRVDRAPLTRRARAVIVCLALGLALPVAGLAVFAQEPGTFTGSVLDPTGRPMDARVKLVNASTGINAEVRTGKIGTFEFSGLPGGEYGVEVTQPGFATLKTAITLGATGVKRDLVLQLGSIVENVSVQVPGGAAALPPPGARAQAASPSRQPRARLTPCRDTAGGGQIEAPRKLSDAKPDYPASLSAERVTGDAVVEGVVDKDGVVRDLRVVEAPHPDLGRALADAVSRWQFEPTLLNCEPVPVKITVKARFEQ